MMVNIANPIYDSVFKYLMEDEFFSAIENRDMALLMKDKKIADQGQKIAAQEQEIAKQKSRVKSVVVTMLDNGLDVVMIAKMTGLTVEEVKELAENR